MTLPVWQQIRDELSAEIAEGRYGAGDRLPTEAQLATRFGVNRHTVRRALKAMADQGLVHARRGAGVFVTGVQLSYRLGRNTRFTQNMAEAGHTGSRDILRAETLPASADEAKALGLKKGAHVHVLELIASADGAPIAFAKTVLPAGPLPGFIAFHREVNSITKALEACGIDDYRRQYTRLIATHATGAMARHLRLSEGAPVLRATSVNVLEDQTPIEYGRSWFATDRVELVVDDKSFR
ncbi:MAG: phosphonate metabolism transcriptional regulator PhnF [Pseudomonadota bacterium]